MSVSHARASTGTSGEPVIDLAGDRPAIDLRDEVDLVVRTRTIPIASAVGRGANVQAAFDHALRLTGCANYNLIRLSSVIPPATDVLESPGPLAPGGGWGDRLYVVYAMERTAVPGQQVWAGVGWVQDPADGRGLFVEHDGHTEEQVRTDIRDSLAEMTAGRRGNWNEPTLLVTGATATEDEAVCALVVASYQTEPWS